MYDCFMISERTLVVQSNGVFFQGYVAIHFASYQDMDSTNTEFADLQCHRSPKKNIVNNG